MFARNAFLPSDEDLLPDDSTKIESEDVEMADGAHPPKSEKKRAAARARRIIDSDEGSDDDMSDFIVEDGEDEEEKDVRRMSKKRLGKQKANVVSDSDEEMEDSPEENQVLYGRKVPLSAGKIELMPKFLPSTKMKVGVE